MVEPRPLSDVEAAIVARLHAINELPVPSKAELEALQVVGGCKCGCASVDFLPDIGAAHVLADGYGVTPSNIEVGLILWERDRQLSGLEIYMLGVDTSELPTPASLHRGDGAPAS
jgi:hypothetical protein